jgi:hypothetical protein
MPSLQVDFKCTPIAINAIYFLINKLYLTLIDSSFLKLWVSFINYVTLKSGFRDHPTPCHALVTQPLTPTPPPEETLLSFKT